MKLVQVTDKTMVNVERITYTKYSPLRDEISDDTGEPIIIKAELKIHFGSDCLTLTGERADALYGYLMDNCYRLA